MKFITLIYGSWPVVKTMGAHSKCGPTHSAHCATTGGTRATRVQLSRHLPDARHCRLSQMLKGNSGTNLAEELIRSESTEPGYPGHLLWAAHPPGKPNQSQWTDIKVFTYVLQFILLRLKVYEQRLSIVQFSCNTLGQLSRKLWTQMWFECITNP